MASCGARYESLLRVGGYGPDNPTGFKPWTSSEDIKGWRAVADEVFTLVRERWNVLMRIERERRDYAQTNKIRDAVEAYEKAHARLPSAKWWQVAGAGDDLVKIVRNAQQGTCMIDLLEQGIAAVGGPALPIADGADRTVPWVAIGSVAGLLAVGTAIAVAVSPAGVAARRALARRRRAAKPAGVST